VRRALGANSAPTLVPRGTRWKRCYLIFEAGAVVPAPQNLPSVSQ